MARDLPLRAAGSRPLCWQRRRPARHTDGQVFKLGEPPGLHSEKSCLSYDVSIVDQSAVSHSGTGACSQSLPNPSPNAGTKLGAENLKAKAIHDKLRVLCQQRASGMEVVLPIIFTASGGMGEQFQRQYRDVTRNPHWILKTAVVTVTVR
jgi:hypothetical protein